jgi:hypothetical protein
MAGSSGIQRQNLIRTLKIELPLLEGQVKQIYFRAKIKLTAKTPRCEPHWQRQGSVTVTADARHAADVKLAGRKSKLPASQREQSQQTDTYESHRCRLGYGHDLPANFTARIDTALDVDVEVAVIEVGD